MATIFIQEEENNRTEFLLIIPPENQANTPDKFPPLSAGDIPEYTSTVFVKRSKYVGKKVITKSKGSDLFTIQLYMQTYSLICLKEYSLHYKMKESAAEQRCVLRLKYSVFVKEPKKTKHFGEFHDPNTGCIRGSPCRQLLLYK